MQDIFANLKIFDAYSDEPWIVNGAAIRVSTVCFGKHDGYPALNGKTVSSIGPDLEPVEVNFWTFSRLKENKRISFVGGQKDGPFEISGEDARALLLMPSNPNGRPNSDVIRPWCNGRDLAKRPSDTWIIDFGNRTEAEAALYEEPFKITLERVKPHRKKLRDKRRKEKWWLHGRPGSNAKAALGGKKQFIATPLTSKHRWFVFTPSVAFPDNAVVVITKIDYTTFGILSSRFHSIWALRSGNFLGVGNDPRYTPTTTFETFPFPKHLAPSISEAAYAGDVYAQRIAAAALELDKLRNNWLNPSDLVRRVPEVVPGYPDRILPVDDKAAAELRKRTLTNLYNQRPAWLVNVHHELDEAVAAAYGWPADLNDEEILERLLNLNQERAAAQTTLVAAD